MGKPPKTNVWYKRARIFAVILVLLFVVTVFLANTFLSGDAQLTSATANLDSVAIEAATTSGLSLYAILISAAAFLVSSVGTASAVILGWRCERRQAAESKLKIEQLELQLDSVPAGYFCIFKEIADLFATMFHHGINPGTKMVLDISVGWHWGSHWTARKLASVHGERKQFGHYYPKYFAQSASNPQDIWCYPEGALPEFRRWMRDLYIPLKMPAYLQTQVAQGKISPQAANNTRVALIDRERRRSLPR